MKLPNAAHALVPSYKITNYLLASSHPVGGSKSLFFTAFGFQLENWKDLSNALKELVLDREVQKMENTPFGVRYTVDGKLQSPIGRRPWVRTVWFIETGHLNPRFVTAYPLVRREE